LSLALVVMFACGCGSSSSKPGASGTPAAPAASSGSVSGDDQPALTMEMVELMKTIKDEATAKAARPKLEALADKIHAIQQQAKAGKLKISDPEAYGKRMSEAMEAYGTEMTRIGGIPEAAMELQGMRDKMKP